jgi:SAM-dependent methyltransferase
VACYVCAKRAILAGGVTDSVDYCIRKGEFVQQALQRGGRSAENGDKAEEHQRLIVDQFTKQAVPFSQMPDHSPELILAAAEVGPTEMVLDVACGPGVLACAFAQVVRHVTGIDVTPAMIEQAKIFTAVASLGQPDVANRARPPAAFSRRIILAGIHPLFVSPLPRPEGGPGRDGPGLLVG